MQDQYKNIQKIQNVFTIAPRNVIFQFKICHKISLQIIVNELYKNIFTSVPSLQLPITVFSGYGLFSIRLIGFAMFAVF